MMMMMVLEWSHLMRHHWDKCIMLTVLGIDWLSSPVQIPRKNSITTRVRSTVEYSIKTSLFRVRRAMTFLPAKISISNQKAGGISEFWWSSKLRIFRFVIVKEWTIWFENLLRMFFSFRSWEWARRRVAFPIVDSNKMVKVISAGSSDAPISSKDFCKRRRLSGEKKIPLDLKSSPTSITLKTCYRHYRNSSSISFLRTVH